MYLLDVSREVDLDLLNEKQCSVLCLPCLCNTAWYSLYQTAVHVYNRINLYVLDRRVYTRTVRVLMGTQKHRSKFFFTHE
jgi:hypothetical protein